MGLVGAADLPNNGWPRLVRPHMPGPRGGDLSAEVNEEGRAYVDERVRHWSVFMPRRVCETLAEWAVPGRRVPYRRIPPDELVMVRRVP